jgi:SAM-dependent methyltransferase/ADP-ribose pyrophosphatase YjhB (NUDIX family)
MPDLTSAALFERDGRVLVAHRRRPPFASQWVLPMTMVGTDEAAEDALRRHARDQFGVGLGEETFLETVYLVDPDDARQYVANIFRTPILDGPMRFNSEGDYDDARWLAPGDLDQLWMPPDLRAPLLQILTPPEAPHETDWSQPLGEGVPLAEQAAAASGVAATSEPAPDNRAGWDAIAHAYQEERYGDRDAGRLKWSRGLHEDELHLLHDVGGKRALVLGCGGGQDVIALSKMGAVAIGIDVSAKQIDYARKYAERHGAENASFVEGAIEDLSRFDDESFDFAVSIHALGYVEDAELAFAEAARVLKAGGVLAIAVPHPFNSTRADDPPYGVVRSYWSGPVDWDWKFEVGASARFREFPRTVSCWFGLLTDAGFVVERLLEPYQGDVTGTDAKGFDHRLAKLMPYVLIMKARKR